MSYKLREDETLGDGIRRICCEQIQGALAASARERNGDGSPVHETRKHLKKARAALRLVSREVSRDLFQREDRRLRNVGRLISEIRDAEVRLQTVKQLREFSRPGKTQTLQETEELLAFELDSFLAAFSDWQQEAKTKLTRARDRIAEWPVAGLDCEQIRRAVQKSYKRARKSLKRATRKPTMKNFHSLRKRGKELWYQMRILRPLHPAIMKELADDLKKIGEHLGHAHDLAFLAERLSTIASGGGKRGQRILSGLIDARQKELQRTAIALAEKFYARRAKQFAGRISEYFVEWEAARLRPSVEPIALEAA
ncbi:MAG: CHAD domain-containing protein [Verrucomicrobiota bacterium]